MRIYYAHCLAIYNTQQEQRDIDVLETLGFKVVNPNSSLVERLVDQLRLEVKQHNERNAVPVLDASFEVMRRIFKPLVVEESDAVAFRALPDGAIPAGIAQELSWAVEAGMRIIELPSGFNRRVLTVDQTREYLREVGQR